MPCYVMVITGRSMMQGSLHSSLGVLSGAISERRINLSLIRTFPVQHDERRQDIQDVSHVSHKNST